MSYFYRNVKSNSADVLGIVNKMTVCQIIFLVIDVGCNLVLDSTSSDPMIGFIIFIIQVVAILANLISFLMISSHDTIQNKFLALKTQVHNLSALTTVGYLTLTVTWYIWSLRRSWPGAGDQFDYTFLEKRNNTNTQLPFGNGFENLEQDRQFSTLWSPGFIALYTAQRTVALLYYGYHSLSMSVLDRMELSSSESSSPSKSPQNPNDLRMRSISAFLDTKQDSATPPSRRSKRKRKAGPDVKDINRDNDTYKAVTSWESEQTLPIGSAIQEGHLGRASSPK